MTKRCLTPEAIVESATMFRYLRHIYEKWEIHKACRKEGDICKSERFGPGECFHKSALFSDTETLEAGMPDRKRLMLKRGGDYFCLNEAARMAYRVFSKKMLELLKAPKSQPNHSPR